MRGWTIFRMPQAQRHFTEKHIRLFSQLLKDKYGIRITREKTDMLKRKLQKMMTGSNVASYDELYELINSSSLYLTRFLDEVTTHTTNFFRESSHFDYITNEINYLLGKNKRIREHGEIRVWSAACSTGEEPYTLAMILKESLPEEIAIKMLATDISRKVVSAAARGVYALQIENEVKQYYLQKYFYKADGLYQVTDDLKSLIKFRVFNLMDPFPFKKDFDIIFCRNVMIYFEGQAQEQLVQRMYDIIASGGLFFIGHSEGLVSKEHRFTFLEPSVYMKA